MSKSGSSERAAEVTQQESAGSPPAGRVPRLRRGKVAPENYQGPPGVDGANVGYWQAVGGSRAKAKRSKRP
jgi:hypothetical protein